MGVGWGWGEDRGERARAGSRGKGRGKLRAAHQLVRVRGPGKQTAAVGLSLGA